MYSLSKALFFFLFFLLPDTCNSPCVSGVCTAKDKCSCDRGFEGSNCNQTATTGKNAERDLIPAEVYHLDKVICF